MIDPKKIRVGDEVTVRAKVVALEPNKLCPEPIRIHGGSWINYADILTHTPKPRELKPGDRVTQGANDFHLWKIIAIDGQTAWLRWDSYIGPCVPVVQREGGRMTQYLHDLHYVDEGE